MRFYDELTRYVYTQEGDPEGFRVIHRALMDTKTKRILFDGKQAATFFDLEEGPPDNVQANLRLPFEDFYLEFETPVRLYDGEYEWTEDTPSVIRALLVRTMPPYDIEPGGIMSTPISVALFASRPNDSQIEMMTFVIDLNYGYCYAPVQTLYGIGVALPIDLEPNLIIPLHPETIGNHMTFRAWVLMNCGSLLSWCLTYMMAKSIEIVPESLPRQQRRWLARKGIPPPWHVVRVDPKILLQWQERDDETPGNEHGYRYDVIGHIRFGNHKRKDGTYSETIEFVRPHQRGLRHDQYVPAVKHFRGGRTAAQEMEKWWGVTRPVDVI